MRFIVDVGAVGREVDARGVQLERPVPVGVEWQRRYCHFPGGRVVCASGHVGHPETLRQAQAHVAQFPFGDALRAVHAEDEGHPQVVQVGVRYGMDCLVDAVGAVVELLFHRCGEGVGLRVCGGAAATFGPGGACQCEFSGCGVDGVGRHRERVDAQRVGAERAGLLYGIECLAVDRNLLYLVVLVLADCDYVAERDRCEVDRQCQVVNLDFTRGVDVREVVSVVDAPRQQHRHGRGGGSRQGMLSFHLAVVSVGLEKRIVKSGSGLCVSAGIVRDMTHS